MYCYAWKAGLKTTYYLRSRPATRIQQATVGRSTPPASPAPATRWPARWRTPRSARPASDHRPKTDTAEGMLLDPGMDLTLRPMRYPDFYERFRAAIRNTWTVEEVDLHADLPDLATADAGRAAPGPPAGGVLRHRRLDRRQQPGAQPLPARQRAGGAAVPVPAAVRGGGARPVLPDPARHLRARPRRAGRRRSRRSRTSRRSGARRSSASAGSTRSFDVRELRDRAPTAGRSCST